MSASIRTWFGTKLWFGRCKTYARKTCATRASASGTNKIVVVLDGEDEPCGEWSHFTLLQSSIPRCFFGHGSICYVAIQPDPVAGGVCKDGACTPFNSTNGDYVSQSSMLAQGRCVACV